MGIGSFLRRTAGTVGRVAGRTISSPLGSAALLGLSFVPGGALAAKGLRLAGPALRTAGRLARSPGGMAGIAGLGAGVLGFGAGRMGGGAEGLPPLDTGNLNPMSGGGGGGGRGGRMTKAQLATLPIVLEGGLMQYTRAPRGYVSIMTAEGPVAMRRDVAIAQGYFRPAKKPLISVRDSNALLRIKHVFKVMGSVNKTLGKVARHAQSGMPRRISAGGSVYIEKGPGNLVLNKKGGR